MTAQTPPTDRPLTAGDVPLLREGDQLKAVETTCTFCAGDIVAFEGPGPLGECMVFGMSWMAKRFSFYARPATSAASEGEEVPTVDTIAAMIVRDARLDLTAGFPPSGRIDNPRTIAANIVAAFEAALASPPVSERERELEGALRLASEAFSKIVQADIHREGFNIDTDRTVPAGSVSRAWVGPLGLIAKSARNAIDRALTAQPAGEGK